MRMGKTFPHFPTRLHCLALVPNANLSSEGCVLATGINWHHRRRLSQVAELVAKMTAEEKVGQVGCHRQTPNAIVLPPPPPPSHFVRNWP